MNIYRIKHLMISGLVAILPLGVSAQNKPTHKISSFQHKEQHKNLLASQKNIHREISLIDSVAFARQLEEEASEFPALDIYGDSWDQEWVNPYKKSLSELPDNVKIDVSDYCMPANSTNITSGYGYRRRFHRMHRGVDLKVQIGDTIRAAFSGKVRLTKYERRGYGYYVIISHNNGLETIYGHLSRFLVKPDQIVKVGDPIALGGNTGRSTGSHLHFETRFLGMDINPELIFDFENQVPHTDQFVFTPNKLSNDTRNRATASYRSNAGKSHSNGSKYVSYRIKSGDNLSKIAQRNGVTINQICKLNGISRNTKLRPGKVLRLK